MNLPRQKAAELYELRFERHLPLVH